MSITAQVGGYREALRLLALDSVNRSFNYYEKIENGIEQVTISQSVFLGSSKIETVLDVPIDSKIIKTPGFTIYYTRKNTEKVEWLTSTLFEKSGIVIDTLQPKAYYKLKNDSKAFKYGYRKLLNCEISKWSKLSENYEKESDLTKTIDFTDYDYKFSLGSDQFSKIQEALLDHLNEKDPKLLEDRLNNLLTEIQDSILNEVQTLINAREIDERLLEDIRNYISNLNSDIRNNFAEILQQQSNLLEFAIKNQQDTVSHLNVASTERREIANENKNHHVETQGLVASVSRKIDQLSIPVLKASHSFKYKVRRCDLKYIKRYNAIGLCKTDEIHSYFYPSNCSKNVDAIPIVFISGLGGTGKSEEGRSYCKFWWDEHEGLDRAMLWIDCTTITSFIDSFISLGSELAIWTNVPKTKKEIIESIYSFFLDRETLFVFDNADEFIQKFLPQSMSLVLREGEKLPNILMTSRTKIWDGEHEGFATFQRVDLGAFTKQEGIDYVKVSLKLSLDKIAEDDDILELCKLLYFLPLAIRQSVAYIQAEKVSVGQYSINEYIAEYNVNGKKLLNFRPYKNDEERYSHTVLTTWLTTLKKIKKQPGGDEAQDILNIIAYLFPNAIRLHEILGISEISNMSCVNSKLKAGIQLLNKYSMIDLDSQNLVYVHALVQEVVRIQLRKPSIFYPIACAVTILLFIIAIFSFDIELSNVSIFSLAIGFTGFISFLYFISNNYGNALDKTEKSTLEKVLCLLNSEKVSQDWDTTAHAALAWHYATKYDSLIDKYYFKTSGIQNLDNIKFPIQRYGTVYHTPLHILSCAYTEAVARLLQRINHLANSKYKNEPTFKGLIINANNKEGRIPLHEACLLQESEIIKLLIENGADITATDNKYGMGMLAWTILGTKRGEIDALGIVLDYIIDKNETLLECQDLECVTPLRHALLTKKYSIAKMLVMRGAKVNADCSNYTPSLSYLHHVVHFENVDMAKFLIKHKADIEARDEDGNTPLHKAVFGNLLNMTKMLCKYGADVNAKNDDEFSPLHISVNHNNFDIIYTLIACKNIDINQLGSHGLTPVELAFYSDEDSREDSWLTVIFLLAAGANVGNRIRQSVNLKAKLSSFIEEKLSLSELYDMTPKFLLVKQLLDSENGEKNINELNEYYDLR